MKSKAYLRVLGTENTIRALHNETNVPNASIKELKARRDEADNARWWDWQTAEVSIDIDKPDDGLKELLLTHKSILPLIRRYEGPETDIYLEVVTHYERGDEPTGLYLSAETILLLSEMGAALDHDVYSDK